MDKKDNKTDCHCKFNWQTLLKNSKKSNKNRIYREKKYNLNFPNICFLSSNTPLNPNKLPQNKTLAQFLKQKVTYKSQH